MHLAEEGKCKASVTVGPLGFWECKIMPFGLTNVPATFQHLIENCMGDLHLSYCLLHLDDIMISAGPMRKLKKAGLKLSPSKLKLFQTRIKYLGHIISEKGVAVNPDKR